jgi:hypothetical protein
MAAEVADKGAALASGTLPVLHLLPDVAEGLRVDGLGQKVEVARAHLVEGEKDLVAEVVDQRVGRAARAQGATSLLLAPAEEALQLVGRRRQVGIIEAVEEVGPVAAGDGDQMVDKGSGLGVEAQAGRCALELREEIPELGLGRGSVLRTVEPVRCGAEVMSYVSEVLHMPLDPAGDTDLMPVEREGLLERIEAGRGHGDAGGVFFCAAASTVWRTCSRR